ncbi:hypothetical protein [Endozoicomonas sp. ALB115]|uniref:hypothetical protein n=1 Tax=Endozoicomonas sp. ALB115 TaxID=3403074 RepID=UPI003BB525E1
MPGYYQYRFNLDLRASDKIIKKTAKLNRLKSWTFEDHIHHYTNYIEPDFINTLDFGICCEEYYWRIGQRRMIFPKDADVLNMLLQAKFSLSAVEGFRLPYDQFILAIPKEYKFAGLSITGVLVTMCRNTDEMNEKIDPFIKVCSKGTESAQTPPDRKGMLTFNFQFTHDPATTYSRISVNLEDLPRILSANRYQDLADILPGFASRGYLHTERCDNAELQAHYELLKLVVSMSVYVMYARSNDRHDILQDGLPGKFSNHQFASLGHRRSKHMTLGSMSGVRENRTSPNSHYRSWHFRQLVHDKYYQNEYQGMEKGSRIVFVSDTLVSSKAKPATLME